MPHYRTLDPKRDTSTRVQFSAVIPVLHSGGHINPDVLPNNITVAKPFKVIPKALQASRRAGNINQSFSFRSSKH
jgi:hypothetical protein